MPKTQTQQTRRNAIYASSPDAPTSLPQRPTSRASTHYIQKSLRKLHTSSPSSSSQVAELQKALEDAKILNAKHQEEIQVLTLERDAAEDALHDSKRHWRALMEDFIDADKELEQTGVSLKQAVQENEAQKAALAGKDHEISELRTANAKYEKELQEITTEKQDQKDALAENDNEISTLRTTNAVYERELLEIASEKSDLESWVAEIKTRVKDVNAHHRVLESKTQTQNDIIGHLKTEFIHLQHNLADHEMNKKALLRINGALKREMEELKAKVVERRDEAEPVGDWKEQCLLTHRGKMLRIEELESEVEALRVRNGELCEGLETLKEEFLRVESEGDGEGSEKNISGRAEVKNGFFEVVTVADMPPSEVIGQSAETVDMSQSTLVDRGKRKIVGSAFGPLVLLGCLLAALLLRW